MLRKAWEASGNASQGLSVPGAGIQGENELPLPPGSDAGRSRTRLSEDLMPPEGSDRWFSKGGAWGNPAEGHRERLWPLGEGSSEPTYPC